MHRRTLARLFFTVTAVLSCGDTTGIGDVVSLSVVSGDEQTGLPGTELALPLVISVTDDRGKKVRGQIVNFRVVSGGGSVFAGAALTDKDGIAQERWTLGEEGPQQLEARAVDSETGAQLTFAVFTATAIDVVPPAVTINQAAGQVDPTNASPILFTVAFSEAVTGFAGEDVSFVGTTVGGTIVASVSRIGASYTVSVTGMNGSGTVVASIPAGAATDAAGNTNAASTSTDNSVTFSNIPPTVTINQAPSQADPTNTGPILFTVVFSEPVIGFTGSDVSLAGSTVGGSLFPTVTGGGTTYTVSVAGMLGTGVVVASIPAGAAVNAAGNASLASTSMDHTILFDATPATVTINQAPSQIDPTNTSPVRFSVLFSETVTGFTGGDVNLSASTVGGTLVATVSGTGVTYVVSVTGMTGIGTVVASLPFAAAIDLVGNNSSASTSVDNTVSFNGAAPSVTIDQAAGQPDPTNASPIAFNVVFSAPVTGFSAADVDFAGSTVGGTLVAAETGSGNAYTVTVTGMNGAGTVVASIPAGAAVSGDGVANFASTSTDNSVTFDNVVPTVTINQAAGQPDPTTGSLILYRVVFSKPVTGFGGDDISFVGSTVGGSLVASVSGTGAVYMVAVTGMVGNGVVQASVPAGAAADLVGVTNTSSTSTDNTVTFVDAAPTVTINQAPAQPDPTNASPILYAVVFSEPVTGFGADDIALFGSTLSGLVATVSGSGAHYTVSVTGMDGVGTVVASIVAGAAFDPVGQSSQASTSTDNQVTFDNVRPTVTLNTALGQPDPTNASPILFTVVFSEQVVGFTGADISFAGSTLSNLVANVSGSGAVYTVFVTGMNGVGSVMASLGASGFSDIAGNSNVASTSTDNIVQFDNVRPTVTIDQAPGQPDPTNASPIVFRAQFSEDVPGFDAGDISFAGSTLSNLVATVSGGFGSYTVSVTGMNGAGTVVASVVAGGATDHAGNGNAASTSTDNTVTFDNVGPMATINQASAQNDPTNSSPVLFTVQFSEDVTGFTASDVNLAGSSLTGLAASVSGSGATYTVSVTGMSGIGTIVASIPDGAVTDMVGNASFASSSVDNTVTFDNARPGVTINQAAGQSDPTHSSPIVFTVQFSEAVVGFTAEDVSLAGSDAGGPLVVSVTGSGASYSVSVTGMTSNGFVVASVLAGAATDLAGNVNTASTSTDNRVKFLK